MESLMIQPLFGTVPATNAATSAITFQWRATLLVVPVSADGLGTASKVPPGTLQGCTPSRNFQLTPLVDVPCPSVQLSFKRWTLYVRDLLADFETQIWRSAEVMEAHAGI